jgi:hypothetical protein
LNWLYHSPIFTSNSKVFNKKNAPHRSEGLGLKDFIIYYDK